MFDEGIEVLPDLTIPAGELSFTFSRSGGPGGQNVNKVSTRATLLFDVVHSPSLTDLQRDRILSVLGSRITREGILQVVSQKHRSQHDNREEATRRMASLLRRALTPRRKRRATRVPAAARRERLEEKTRRSRIKKQRAPVREEG